MSNEEIIRLFIGVAIIQVLSIIVILFRVLKRL